MANDKERIRKGIAAYSHEQEVILEVIRENGGKLTQQEFDAEFQSFIETETIDKDGRRKVTSRRNPRQFSTLLSEDAFILGGFMQGSWGKWLELLQCMRELGIVESTGKSPNVVYQLPEKEK